MPKKYPIKYYWKRTYTSKSKTGTWKLHLKDAHGDHRSLVSISTNIGFELYIPDSAFIGVFSGKQLKKKLKLRPSEEIFGRHNFTQTESIQLSAKWKKKILTALNGLMKERF